MPKFKTKKAASKRFTLTGTGKLKRFKANKQHKTAKKTAKKRRELRHATTVDATKEKNMKAIMPYL